MQDKITAALQKHGRPLSPGALAQAIGTGTGPLRKVVDGMIAAGALKATGERRGRRIGLPDMEFAGADESQTPPQRQKKHRKAKHAKAPRRAKPAPRARTAAEPSPSGAPVGERFIPTVDIESRLVIVNGGEPHIFSEGQTAAIASLLFQHYDKE